MSSHQSQVAIPETRVSGKAILALCIGVLTLGVAFGRLALGSERDWGIITLLIVGSILSLLFCHLANGEARQSNHTLAGIGAAKVGLWLASLGFVFFILVSPYVYRMHRSAARFRAFDQLKRLGDAIHEYAWEHEGRLPPAAIRNAHGRPLLSWRVLLLPYLGQQELFDQFKLDEPWNSPHNLKLLDRIPDVLKPARGILAEKEDIEGGRTFYQAIVGPGSVFDPRGMTFSDIVNADGGPSTLLLVHGVKAVPWTKPEDISFEPNGPLPQIGEVIHDLTCNREHLILLADGSIRPVPIDHMNDRLLRLLILWNDGQPLPPDW